MVDYIIVGAGSAGCVLANRLTEDASCSVLLLEAGGPDNNPDIRIPGRWPFLLNTELDWLYQTEPQVHANNRVIDWNRGKVVGGSSSINAMVYIRGNRWDYDNWAELGNEAWSYEEVLPYFKKSENQERGASAYHGVGGLLNVADLKFHTAASEIFMQAAAELGWTHNEDFNGAIQDGYGRYQVTHKDGERHSTAAAFIKPILNRENLSIKTYAHTTRILFEGTRAIGVEYVHDNQIKQAFADKEVILCAGAINSPQILLLSGIGSAQDLEKLDIPVVVDLAGVGANLQDHPLLLCTAYKSASLQGVDRSLSGEAYREYLEDKTGLLAGNYPEMGGFIKTRPELKVPDIQLYGGAPSSSDEFDCIIGASLMRPFSRGYIALRSNNSFDYPIIQPNYLQEKEDLQTFVDAVKIARQCGQTATLQKHIDTEFYPGKHVQSDEDIAEWVREALQTTWHFVGTCKMGLDEMAVVNPQLQVHGTENLRVVDGSIIPEIVGGNTNAPIIMIAEKAADMIKGA